MVAEKRIWFILLVSGVFLLLFSFVTSVNAENYLSSGSNTVLGAETRKSNPELKIPSGMENIRIGNVNHIVPIGTKVERKGDIVIFESSGEFMARRFLDIESRLENMEKEVKKMGENINLLKEEGCLKEETSAEVIQAD